MSLSGQLGSWFSNYDMQKSLGSRLRKQRIAPLKQLIEEVYESEGTVNIIDLGGTEQYWGIFPKQYLTEFNVKVTIVNLAYRSKPEDHGPFTFVEADACDLQIYDDLSFHITHSNSVVEHVGDWERMKKFAKESSRISRHYFIQTPNYWFPMEPHFVTPFFQWLPKPTKVWLVMNFQLGHLERAETVDDAMRTVEGTRLLNKKMFRELFPDANISTEWFLGLPKSFIAVKRSDSD